MDTMQAELEKTLFLERHPPTARAGSNIGKAVHMAFWQDAFHRNLSLQHVEVEVRFGLAKEKFFDTNVNDMLWEKVVSSFSTYTQWDKRTSVTEIVSYFPDVDASVRVINSPDGSVTAYSKQRVSLADFRGNNLPFDLRLAVSLELPVATTAYPITTATKSVTRQRHSFSIGDVRYDLSKLTHHNGRVEHQMEIELLDLPNLQLTHSNAQELAMQLQDRVVDVMNCVEPVRRFDISLLKRRQF